jgi:hypothetical protein
VRQITDRPVTDKKSFKWLYVRERRQIWSKAVTILELIVTAKSEMCISGKTDPVGT